MQIVKLDSGHISGTVLGNPDKPVYVFRGIPYAAPPVGDLRWKPPQPVKPWEGIRECTVYSAIAPQPIPPAFTGKTKPQSEDCLYLNVLTPAKQGMEKLPVMVWIHPGGFTSSNGNENGFNGLPLPLSGVVLVSVNTRLGVLGCTAHPLLSRESPRKVSGNYLFLDLIAALQWVQNNVAAFGGDPSNVTVFGQSGGCSKINVLMASPMARGLFHKAIGESGGGTATPLKEMEARGERLFAILGIDKEKDPLTVARAMPFEKIVEAGRALAAEIKTMFGAWDAAVDDWMLKDTPLNTFLAGKHNAMPFLQGSNLGELTGSGMFANAAMVQLYVNLFKGNNKTGDKSYTYVFDHVPANWKKDGCVASHCMELPYVFGDFDIKSDLWAAVYTFGRLAGIKSNDPGLSDVDKELSKKVMKLWVNFAKTGNPGILGIIDWPAWDEEKDQYLYITEEPEARSGFSKVGQKKWEEG